MMKPLMNLYSLALLTLLVHALSSCTSQTTSRVVNSSSSEASEAGLERYQGGYKMVKDEETGFVRPVSERKISPFSQQTSQYSGQNIAGNQVYKKKEFDSKRWQGADQRASKKSWHRSNEEFQRSPQFIKDNAKWSGIDSRESTLVFARDQYQTNSAREERRQKIEKTSDRKIQRAQQSFVQPQIISNQTYNNSGRSVNDVKQLLNE